jgi:signal peptidase I
METKSETDKTKDLDKSKESPQDDKNNNGGNIWLFFWDLIKIIVVALIIIIPVRYYLIQPFIVSGSSMEPTFQNGQYLIVNELDYRMSQPARGDVIVFKFPQNTSEYFIKRVIGLPGEKVLITDGHVVIYNAANPNGFVLDESYLPAGTITAQTTNQTVELGAGEYFVLGDNRDASSDSRFWGDVPSNDIIGKVVLRAYPFNQVKTFSTPQYN